MEKKEGKKKELKITRGYSLSKANVMALREESLEQTMATTDGSIVSQSAVLDDILTIWRETKDILVVWHEKKTRKK